MLQLLGKVEVTLTISIECLLFELLNLCSDQILGHGLKSVDGVKVKLS